MNRYFLIYCSADKYYNSIFINRSNFKCNVLIKTKDNHFPSKKEILDIIKKEECWENFDNLSIINIYEFKDKNDYEDFIGIED